MGLIPTIPSVPFSNSLPTPELGPGISDDANNSIINPTPATKKRSFIDASKQPATRGIIAPKDFKYLEDEVLFFQYNPAEIQDTKATEWVTKSYTGFSSQDYMWVKGGERILSFKLFFDATASSVPMSYNLADVVGDLKTIYPRGIMPMVEKLTKFLYPAQEDTSQPIYSSYGIIPTVRFEPPPLAILVFGDLYLEGIVADVGVSYTLFNKELQPIRGECQIKFKVLEGSVVVKDKRLNR
jgi:hypothetical protein